VPKTAPRAEARGKAFPLTPEQNKDKQFPTGNSSSSGSVPIRQTQRFSGTVTGGAMSDSLFSTYTKGENRVTASILAVLRSLALGRIERLLGALLEQSEFELVRFQNQPSRGASGTPDAEIVSSCRLLIETKVGRNAVRHDQLKRHLQRLDHNTATAQGLLLLTPDDDARLWLTTSPTRGCSGPRSLRTIKRLENS
jgi:hypothetical protein